MYDASCGELGVLYMLYELEELDIYKAFNCIMNVSYDFPLLFEEINVIGSLISIFCLSRQIIVFWT